MSTLRLRYGGTTRIARLIPSEIAATSLDIDLEGTVRRATTSIVSSVPSRAVMGYGRWAESVVISNGATLPCLARSTDAIPSCLDPPCSFELYTIREVN
jgi:hypothetical protein